MINSETLSELNMSTIIQTVENNFKKLEKLRPLDKETESRVIQKLRLEWNFHSNAIEGNTLNYGETVAFLMHGITAKGKPFKDYLDIKGHNLGIDFLIDFVRNKEELREVDIRNLHSIILIEPYEVAVESATGIPSTKTISIGSYKTLPNHVKTATGEIHHYVDPQDVPFRINELLTWFRHESTKGNLHPLILATVFHHVFTEIHPFDDGNGRMARLLMNLILLQSSYPPIIIKQDKGERNQYYYSLSIADAGDLFPFLEFLANCLNRSITLYLKAAAGESIDDADDFDKELQLFKKEFEGNIAKIDFKKTIEFQNKIISDFIAPIVAQIDMNCRKLKEFFFDYELTIFDTRSASYEDYSKEALYRNLDVDDLKEITIGFDLKGFKQENNSFNCFSQIEFLFNEFRFETKLTILQYRVDNTSVANLILPNGELVYTEVYNKIVAREGALRFATSISMSILAFVRKLEKDPNAFSLPFDERQLEEDWDKLFDGKKIVKPKFNISRSNLLYITFPAAYSATLNTRASIFFETLRKKYDLSATGLILRIEYVADDELPF